MTVKINMKANKSDLQLNMVPEPVQGIWHTSQSQTSDLVRTEGRERHIEKFEMDPAGLKPKSLCMDNQHLTLHILTGSEVS
jgi:hypothetical protein